MVGVFVEIASHSRLGTHGAMTSGSGRNVHPQEVSSPSHALNRSDYTFGGGRAFRPVDDVGRDGLCFVDLLL